MLARYLALWVFAAVAGCRGTGEKVDTTSSMEPAVDSIVLERTGCFGSCPAYRLGVTSTGGIHFVSLTPGDSGRVATDTTNSAAYASLVSALSPSGFFDLPKVIEGDELCALRATDHPTAIVTAFRREGPHTVEHYLGCHTDRGDGKRPGPHERLARLIALEDHIDSIARSSRWIAHATRN